MWPRNTNTHASDLAAVCALPRLHSRNEHLVAARADTDHTTGVGQVAITGRYDSKKDSFGVDASYLIDDGNTVYGTYGVTDEKLQAMGVESGATMFGRRVTVDATYLPPRDAAQIKVGVRQGKSRVSAVVALEDVRKEKAGRHSERYELEARLNAVESLRMSFEARSRAARVKVARRLDAKNCLEAEYCYAHAGNKYVSLTLKHQYSKTHTVGITTDYGARKYGVEWACKTENGPWTVATTFPFTTGPHKGDWHIKRRFEF